MKSLPEVHEGDVLDNVSASVTEHFTTPPKQYTDCLLYTSNQASGDRQILSKAPNISPSQQNYICLLYTSRCV